MATEIIQFNNPFDPTDRTVLLIEPGVSVKHILEKIDYNAEYYDIIVAKNNEIIDAEFVVEEDDVIMFSLVPKGGGGGGGKQIAMIVAMIAIAVVAPMVAGAVMASTAGLVGAGVYGGLSGSIIFGALVGGIMVGSGLLLNAIFKPDMPSYDSGGLSNFENSPTYGWNTAGNAMQQGGAVPIVYGKVRVVPTYIGKNLTTIDNKQYLSLLMAIGEGPVDAIYGIEINDQPLANFKDVLIADRKGTNDQTVLPLWTDTWTDQSVNKKIANTTDWVYATTKGDGVTELSVGIVFPAGLYYANDAGGLSGLTVKIDAEYRLAGGTWAQLTSHMINGSDIYVDQNPIARTTTNSLGQTITEYYPDNVGPYDHYVQKWVSTGSKWGYYTNDYVGVVSQLPPVDGMTTIQFSTGVYAYQNLISVQDPYISISASQNSPLRRSFLLTGLPAGQYEVRMRLYEQPPSGSRYGSDVVFEYLQEAISDDFTYPNTALLSLKALATDQISGGMPKVSTIVERTTGTYGRLDNPAWACLDLLMNNRYGAGIPIDRIDFDSFSSWATYCDQQNFKVNIYLDQLLSLSTALNTIGQLGRGSVIQYGSTFTALVDRPKITPVQGFLFSMGNIIQNSFTESFLPLKDRANIVEVTYYDENEGYTKTSVEVSAGNYDLTNTVSKSTINLLGCTSREQALRQAKYHLNQNRYLTITATWEASIDAIHCRVGDIVNVAHDVPQWGYSGRIISASGNQVVVDRNDLTLVAGKTFYVQISNALNDNQLYHHVTAVNGDTLTLSTPIAETVGEYSVYSFGEVNRHAKQMRVLSIATSGELKRTISAIEYNQNIYDDTIVVQAPTLVSDLTVSSIQIHDYLRLGPTGAIETVVALSWRGSLLSYDVSYIEHIAGASPVTIDDIRNNNTTIAGLKDGSTYTFTVNGVSQDYTIVGRADIPDPVTSLTGSESMGNYILTWVYTYYPLDFDHFNVYLNGVLLGQTIDTKYQTFSPSSKSKTFGVRAVDTSGNESPMTTAVVSPTSLSPVTGLKSYYLNETTQMVWDAVSDLRSPIDYEIRMGEIWENGYIIGRTAVPQYTVSANGFYMVKAHYQYSDGTDLYSSTEAQINITGAVLPKNIVATWDEKATGWLGTKTNVYVNPDGNLELLSQPMDGVAIIDVEPEFNYMGGIALSGIYEIPSAHIIDIGTAQQCRIWMDYKAEGLVVTNRWDSQFAFDDWVGVDGYSSAFGLVPQISIAQNDGVFGPWEDFVVGDYVGRKFKFRGLFYSYDFNTTCILSRANFFVDMPDKLQSGNGVLVPVTGVTITYPVAFQVPPNNQITITSAVDGDDIILTNETATGFNVVVKNGGVAVQRTINWLAKGY